MTMDTQPPDRDPNSCEEDFYPKREPECEVAGCHAPKTCGDYCEVHKEMQ